MRDWSSKQVSCVFRARVSLSSCKAMYYESETMNLKDKKLENALRST